MLGRSAILLLAIGHLGCSTTSTIYRYNGGTIEGHIEGGSPTAIAVSDARGSQVVPRSEIAEIDYPGNVHATVGGIFLGYGILNIAVGLPECQRQQDAAFCTGVFVPAALGAGMLIWGLVTNLGAKRREQDQTMAIVGESPYSAPVPPPVAVPPPAVAPVAPPAPAPSPAAPAPEATPPAPAAPAPAAPAPAPAPQAPAAEPPPPNTRSFPSDG